MKKGLNAITEKTESLWNEVCKKYGQHAYRLAVNGLDQVELTKGYTEVIATGNKEIQSKLRELLNA